MQAGAASNDGGGGKGEGHDKDKPKGEDDKQGVKPHGGAGDGDGAWIQSVIRAPGACGAPVGNASVIASFADATTSDFDDPVADGMYCYWIEFTDAATVTASEGLTVVVAARANRRLQGRRPGLLLEQCQLTRCLRLARESSASASRRAPPRACR